MSNAYYAIAWYWFKVVNNKINTSWDKLFPFLHSKRQHMTRFPPYCEAPVYES